MRGKRGGTGRSTRPKTAAQLRRSASRTDWARVDATTEEEIAEQIRSNPDDMEFTDEMFAEARWIYPEKKVPISLRVDPYVLTFFKSGGEGYQSRMNAVLRSYANAHLAKGIKTGAG
jgi:uncharacterized protein (DUF4415 family)